MTTDLAAGEQAERCPKTIDMLENAA